MIGHERRGTWVLLPIAVWLIGVTVDVSAEEPAGVNIPLVNKDGGVGLTIAPVSGVDVSAKVIAGEETDGTATRLTFNNPLAERRIAALEGVPAGALEGARVFAFDCTYTGGLGSRSEDPFGTFGSSHPALVALFLESDGGSWYQMINRFEWDPFAWQEIRIPLKGRFARAHFATDSDEAIRWEQVLRVWLGVVSDGPMKGTLQVRRTRFTDEPFHPTSPIRLGKTWEVAQDPAVRGKLSLLGHPPREASFEFELPGGRHMYAMIRTSVEVDELDAYSGLRFTCLANLPEGIDGLLVMLIERDGTQYQAVPPPTATDEQQTITIPFEQFVQGSWSKDENDQLDLEQVSHVAIGMHGTTPEAASGRINISSPQFVP